MYGEHSPAPCAVEGFVVLESAFKEVRASKAAALARHVSIQQRAPLEIAPLHIRASTYYQRPRATTSARTWTRMTVRTRAYKHSSQNPMHFSDANLRCSHRRTSARIHTFTASTKSKSAFPPILRTWCTRSPFTIMYFDFFHHLNIYKLLSFCRT